ncbi:phosphate ABC transporter phosphate-binding protein [Gemmiger sp. An120]|uniref:phosphate ABC transporter substrate-binding protein n=1 Tax=Gemmiger TaxID=204475 RepID=UPI000B371ACC|nr:MULTISPECIES: phosphate ABC transporter substrate-binding protein [Gemmiger]MBM6915550.1 phosphate ABC transporter substrate-binding protein [Gemmiger formicilis]OUQ41739.1 phosphate ABC transporter phosphate-binding protein [Gemmiger sp. An120]
MKKILAIVLALVLALGLLTACGASSSSSQAPAEESSSASTPASEPAEESVSGVVNVSGSTSMESVVLALGEAFKEMYPDVTVNYSGTGSGAGVEAAQTGTSDIGLSSRELKEEETAAGAVANVVAKDGVAVIVNPANGVEDLTVEQIADIFSGKITNWSELGGEDMEIAVYGREAGSGTRGAFEEIVGVVDACQLTNEYSSTGDLVGNVAGNENAIGYASLSAVDETVKAVKVAGVECTEDTVKDGSYAIQRPFVMVTKEGTELSAAAQAFLDYAMSAEAAPIIAAAGAVSANA